MFGPSHIYLALYFTRKPYTDVHRKLAEFALGLREKVNTPEELEAGINIVLAMTEDEIKVATIESLKAKGLPLDSD